MEHHMSLRYRGKGEKEGFVDVHATIEINALVLFLVCVLAYVGLGVISRMFMPKLRYWAVVEPSDNHVVAIHRNKEYAETLVSGNRYLVEMVGILKTE
jgi:hypothetical protein